MVSLFNIKLTQKHSVKYYKNITNINYILVSIEIFFRTTAKLWITNIFIV